MLAGQAESAPQDNSLFENELREPPEPAPGIATGRKEAGEEEKIRQEGPSLTPLSSDGSSRLPGRDGPGTRRRAPGAARASRSCFVTRTGPHPAAPGAEPRPGLSSRAAIQPAPSPNSGLAAPARPRCPPSRPAPPPLTCRMLLFSDTANSSFSLGVFTVTLMIRGSAAEPEPWAGVCGGLRLPVGPSALSDMAGEGPGLGLPGCCSKRPLATPAPAVPVGTRRALMTSRFGEVARKGRCLPGRGLARLSSPVHMRGPAGQLGGARMRGGGGGGCAVACACAGGKGLRRASCSGAEVARGAFEVTVQTVINTTLLLFLNQLRIGL